ncbi:bZIP transcription factor 11-like [Durio zibethinus]|uniref:BZIP transcription factor 11-like n=1 Tax=Durio zibethinus TaxID=66656 RepID=A0A6P6AB44_DURZI|nr:bZIP transcription factor 11-like [Durio zibethinus]
MGSSESKFSSSELPLRPILFAFNPSCLHVLLFDPKPSYGVGVLETVSRKPILFNHSQLFSSTGCITFHDSGFNFYYIVNLPKVSAISTAPSSVTSSGSSTLITNSGSEEDLQALMDERKRKRMISNRESARRSRMRKQKHLDDLMVQVTQLRKENHQFITSINITTQLYVNVEAENSVLRAQVNELSHRLQSLNEIISFLNGSNGGNFDAEDSTNFAFTEPADSFLNPFNLAYLNQPIMASADNMF